MAFERVYNSVTNGGESLRGRGRGHTGPGPYTQAGGARAARHAVRPPGTEYRGRLFLPRPSPRMKVCGGFWAVPGVYL